MYYLIISFPISAILYDFPYYTVYHMQSNIVFSPFLYLYMGNSLLWLVNIIKKSKIGGQKKPKVGEKYPKSGEK